MDAAFASAPARMVRAPAKVSRTRSRTTSAGVTGDGGEIEGASPNARRPRCLGQLACLTRVREHGSDGGDPVLQSLVEFLMPKLVDEGLLDRVPAGSRQSALKFARDQDFDCVFLLGDQDEDSLDARVAGQTLGGLLDRLALESLDGLDHRGDRRFLFDPSQFLACRRDRLVVEHFGHVADIRQRLPIGFRALRFLGARELGFRLRPSRQARPGKPGSRSIEGLAAARTRPVPHLDCDNIPCPAWSREVQNTMVHRCGTPVIVVERRSRTVGHGLCWASIQSISSWSL